MNNNKLFSSGINILLSGVEYRFTDMLVQLRTFFKYRSINIIQSECVSKIYFPYLRPELNEFVLQFTTINI